MFSCSLSLSADLEHPTVYDVGTPRKLSRHRKRIQRRGKHSKKVTLSVASTTNNKVDLVEKQRIKRRRMLEPLTGCRV